MFRVGNIRGSNKYKGAKFGDYKAVCDRTGVRYYASEMAREWNGFFVRKKSWERRQPQDFVRGKKDDMTLPIYRPRKALTPVPLADQVIFPLNIISEQEE